MQFYRTTDKGLVLTKDRPNHGWIKEAVELLHPARTLSAAILAMGAAVTAFGVSSPADNRSSAKPRVVIDHLVVPTAAPSTMKSFRSSVEVATGDTLEGLLHDNGARDAEFLSFARNNPTTEALRQLRPGNVMHVDIDSLGRVMELRYSLGIDEVSMRTGTVQQLHVTRTLDGLQAQIKKVPLAKTTRMASTTIESSLFQATSKADIPTSVASQIADVFGNEVRFDRDIRRGDVLKIIYEMLQEPDSFQPPEPGRMIAAELINGNERHTAIWVPGPNGTGQYYDFDGRSAASTFLRYPIEFSRISSGFSKARLHPVFGRKRAHNGTDFAARRGTKIRATADGIVRSVGTQTGYGRTVVLQHGKKYTTLYAHMRGFRKGLRVGAKVEQGDVIGYVGSSGWATGPHVHYEIHADGRPVNPLTVKLPQAQPLGPEMLARHTERVIALRSQFALLDQVRLASGFR